MGDDENWRCEFDIDGLSLIDVSAEDDSLLFSSFLDPTSFEFSDIDKEDRGFCLFGDTHNCDEEILVSYLEDKEEVLQPHQSPEPDQKMAKSGKYNLRKSLAWDKAFFNNAGVLEPDELSSMIESKHMGQKTNLRISQENVYRSTESISTLQSDCTLETDIDKEQRGFRLFGDTHNCDEEILVSYLKDKEEVLQPHQSPEPDQKMAKNEKYNLRKSLAWDKAFFTNAEKLSKSGVLEPDELSGMIESKHMGQRINLPTSQENVNRSTESISTLQSDCTVETATSMLDDPGSQEKIKTNAIRTRSSIRAQGLGKKTKQPVASKEHNPSISRLTNRLGKSARVPVDVNKAKQEKNPRLTVVKEPLAARVPISCSTRPIVSKPVVPFKSSLRSSVASKNELTSSCSSLESYATISSSASNKSSRDTVKQKKDETLRKASHSLGNGSTVRTACKSLGQPKTRPLSASRSYKSKLSSNVSPLSSSVGWSSESPRGSTPNNMSKGNQKTVPGEKGHAIDVSSQTLKLLNNSKDVSAVQDDLEPDKKGAEHGLVVNCGTVRSASMIKPSGLRVPSPKLGYVDKSISVARIPTRSCTGPGSGLAKLGACSPDESTARRTKPGKSQPTRSPLIQESTNSRTNDSPVSRSPRLIVSASASSPKLTNKVYSKVSAEEQLKGNQEKVT